MGSWTVLSFGVVDPEERLARVRPHLTVNDFITLTDKSMRGDDGGVLALTTSRRYEPSPEQYSRPRHDDVTIYGPYMDLVLEPGEYGCVLGVSNSADAGSGPVYYKRKSDGAIEVIDWVEGYAPNVGKAAADECYAKFGFRPAHKTPPEVRHNAYVRHDPFVLYDRMYEVETALVDPEKNVFVGPDCPNCGTTGPFTDESNVQLYIKTRRCDHCSGSYGFVRRDKLQAHDQQCSCGGEFERRELQYPGLGSTAYECTGCGIVTFDVLERELDELAPHVPYSERDCVHPDYRGFYDGHGKKSVWPPELA
ncbi:MULTISPECIES: hypothetical protein [Haloferax]|uniref:Uncharacterized protein n=1 Tax=Haloferax marinum TaxID=2666143 RepID=A0A6A8GC61_9EURY|nr:MULTISPECIES: hypothetical protein [Haloferax]KAB1198687.1 hypothetical protein Hfx1150_14635 [Haloferax sp. CBA1150]MRW97803.1 hypothetical protein [Haloferax marinum]